MTDRQIIRMQTEKIERLNKTVTHLEFELREMQENASRFCRKTLELLQSFGMSDHEIFEHYGGEDDRKGNAAA